MAFENAPGSTPAASSYREILKSTSLIGGATAINILVGIVRTKLTALILGPAGIGLLGVYTSIYDLTRSIAGMGLQGSGVRQIADAVASNDETRVHRTSAVLRRTSLVLGLMGACGLLFLAEPVATFTFGDPGRSSTLGWVAVAVAVTLFADGQAALLQGTRRIGDIARIGVISGVIGSVAAVAMIYLFGLDGVAPALMVLSVITAVTAWLHARRLHLRAPAMGLADVWAEASALLRLGCAFMASGLLMMGASYLNRIIILRELGLHGAGLYQAAWTIGGLYVGFILQAMGTDFYPRLVAAGNDDAQCNRLVNEQATVSMLLAGPGVLLTLVLAPAVLSLAYTSRFSEGVDVLRWFCLGIGLRVISWPMGFIIVARNSRILFIATELAWTVFNITATWLLVKRVGLAGAGIAFFASYLFHIAMIYPCVRVLSGFRWSKTNLGTGLLYTSLAAAVFSAFQVLPPWPATILGLAATLGSTAYCVRALVTLVPPQRVPRGVYRVLARLHIVRPDGAPDGVR